MAYDHLHVKIDKMNSDLMSDEEIRKLTDLFDFHPVYQKVLNYQVSHLRGVDPNCDTKHLTKVIFEAIQFMEDMRGTTECAMAKMKPGASNEKLKEALQHIDSVITLRNTKLRTGLPEQVLLDAKAQIIKAGEATIHAVHDYYIKYAYGVRLYQCGK